MVAEKIEWMSQYGQDKWVQKLLKNAHGLVFCDVGAYTGYALSNTYALQKSFGWTGLCIEPNSKTFAILQEKRGDGCICDNSCIGGKRGECDFAEAGTLGGIVTSYDKKHVQRLDKTKEDWKARIVKKDVVLLADVLRKHKAPIVIDFMSIDTEGSELDILKTFPWDRYQVRLLVVEHNNYPSILGKMKAVMKPHGFTLSLDSHGDAYFVNRGIPLP